MQLQQGHFCPLIGKDCIQMQCSWFTQVRGKNPQTGQDVDEWACAVTWIPLLQIETTQQTMQAGAAIESFRNETVKSNDLNRQILEERTPSHAPMIPVNPIVHKMLNMKKVSP